MKTKEQSYIYNNIARKLYPNQSTSAAGKRMAYVKGYQTAEKEITDKAMQAFCITQCGECNCHLVDSCTPFVEFKQVIIKTK